MTEQDNKLSELELAQKQDIFRYTDLSHPLIQVLFNFKLKQAKSSLLNNN